MFDAVHLRVSTLLRRAAKTKIYTLYLNINRIELKLISIVCVTILIKIKSVAFELTLK